MGQCPGPLGELKYIDTQACDGDPGKGSHPDVQDVMRLHPLQELRHAQLKDFGWHVEVLRDSEWPRAMPDEDNEALQRREELFLRRTLSTVLPMRVPAQRRQRSFSPWSESK